MILRKAHKYLLFVLLLSLCSTIALAQSGNGHQAKEEHAATNRAQVELPRMSLEADVSTKYIFHGLIVSKGAALQPKVRLNYRNFMLLGWSNVDFGAEKAWNLIGVLLAYQLKLGDFSIMAAMHRYNFMKPVPPGPPSQWEFSYFPTYTIGDFQIYNEGYVYFGDKSLDGAFFTRLGSRYNLSFGQKLNAYANASVGFANNVFNKNYIVGPNFKVANEWGVNTVEAGIGCMYMPWQHFFVHPHVAMSWIPNTKFQNLLKNSPVFKQDPFTVWAGTAVGFVF